MRLLLLTGQFPYPPHAGGALLIYGLHQAGYTVDLLTFVEPGQAEPASTPLANLCGEIITVPAPTRKLSDRLQDLLFTRRADMARRFYSPYFADALTAQLSRMN